VEVIGASKPGWPAVMPSASIEIGTSAWRNARAHATVEVYGSMGLAMALMGEVHTTRKMGIRSFT